MALTLINNTSTISFCDKECANITNNHFKKALFHILDTRYKIAPVSNSIYVKIDCNKMKNITIHPHILTTLTNGNPYMLYFTIIDGRNVVLFIDRKKKENHTFPKIHVLTYNFTPQIFNETIMSGELVRDTNKNWFILLDNIYVYNGKSLQDANILTRFELIHTIMRDNYTPSASDICLFQIKKLFAYKDVKTIFSEFMPRLSYVCKGLVFYTLNPKFTNFCYELPKEEQIQAMSSEDVEKLVRKHRHTDATDAMLTTDGTTDDINRPHSDSSPSPVLQIPDMSPSSIVGLETKEDEETTISTVEIKSYAVFKILKTDKPDIYQLYLLEKKQPKLHGIALIPNIKISKMMRLIFKDNQLNCKMRCTYSKIFERWIPKEVVPISINENVNTQAQIVKIIAHLTATTSS